MLPVSVIELSNDPLTGVKGLKRLPEVVLPLLSKRGRGVREAVQISKLEEEHVGEKSGGSPVEGRNGEPIEP